MPPHPQPVAPGTPAYLNPPPASGGPEASTGWRIRHSLWLLVPILGMSCMSGIGLIYVGLRARRPGWWIPGIAYLLLGWASFVVIGEFEKENPVTDWAVGVLLLVWVVSVLHSALANSEWLRWRAGYRPWYAPQTVAPGWPGARAAAPAWPGAGTPVPAWPVTPTYPSPPYGQPASPWYGPGPVATPVPPSGASTAHPEPDSAWAQPAVDPWADPPPSSAPPSSGTDTPSPEGKLVDVNLAGTEQLAGLSGFDADRVRAVLDERSRRGGFGSVAEFAAAADLAPHEYAKLRDVLVCAPPAGPGQTARVVDV